MKNRSVLIKILIFGSVLLILLLLVVIFSLVKMFLPTREVKKENKRIISKSYQLDEIDNISFDFKKANSYFELNDSEELLIVQNSKEEKFHLNSNTKRNNLYFEEDSYIINPQKKKYTIYIPKKYMGKVTIINGFGDIDENGVTNDLYINNNAGKVNIENSRNIKIKDVSGNVSFENIEGNIIAESSTGNISVKNITGITNIESITGDISISNFNIIGDSYFENVSGDIILDMADGSICKINASNENGKTKIDEDACEDKIKMNIINVKNVTGIIKIY